MDTNDIRCFRHVYEEKSINKAARQLFITPQGLSKIIQHLEEDLQTKLFERSAKGMHPTESGTYLYENCRGLLNCLEELEIGVRRINEHGNKIQIGFACGVLNVIPYTKLDTYKEQLENMQIEWDESENADIIEKVSNGTQDIGFVIGQISRPDLYIKEIFNIKPDAIIYEGHPLYGNENISIGDLRDEPLITLNEKFDCYHSLIQRCRDFDFVPHISIKTMDSQLIYRFCKKKLGIGIDINIHEDEMNMKALRRIEIADSFSWKISVICREKRLLETPIQKMLALF